MKYNFSNIKCLDIYLSSLTNEAYNDIKHEIIPMKAKSMPLLSWDIFSQHYSESLVNLKMASDIELVKLFAEKAKWENDMDAVFKNPDFEALIITDIDQKYVGLMMVSHK